MFEAQLIEAPFDRLTRLGVKDPEQNEAAQRQHGKSLLQQVSSNRRQLVGVPGSQELDTVPLDHFRLGGIIQDDLRLSLKLTQEAFPHPSADNQTIWGLYCGLELWIPSHKADISTKGLLEFMFGQDDLGISGRLVEKLHVFSSDFRSNLDQTWEPTVHKIELAQISNDAVSEYQFERASSQKVLMILAALSALIYRRSGLSFLSTECRTLPEVARENLFGSLANNWINLVTETGARFQASDFQVELDSATMSSTSADNAKLAFVEIK